MSGSGAWKNTVERERSGNRAVSGSYRRRCERWEEISTAPTPQTCSEFVRNGEIWVAKSVTWWLLNSVVCTIARVVSGHCGQCWRTDGLIHSVASRPPTLCNCPPSVHCRSRWLKNGLVFPLINRRFERLCRNRFTTPDRNRLYESEFRFAKLRNRNWTPFRLRRRTILYSVSQKIFDVRSKAACRGNSL